MQKQLTFASGMVGEIVVRFFNLCIKQLMSFDPDLRQQQLRLDLQVQMIPGPHMHALRQPVVLWSHTGSINSLQSYTSSMFISSSGT